MREPKNKLWYAVYLRKTDELLCCGSAEECAEALGVKYFHTLVSRVRRGENKKYEIYTEQYGGDGE